MKLGRLKMMMFGSLLLVVALVRGEQEGCAHPAVPAGAFYTNMTGGLGQEAWKIKYKCDIGKFFSYVIYFIYILNFFPNINPILSS